MAELSTVPLGREHATRWRNEAITVNQSYSDRTEIGQISWLDEETAEISLLMPGWQAAQLLTLATRQRVTVGQLLRDLFKHYLARRTPTNKRRESEVLTP